MCDKIVDHKKMSCHQIICLPYRPPLASDLIRATQSEKQRHLKQCRASIPPKSSQQRHALSSVLFPFGLLHNWKPMLLPLVASLWAVSVKDQPPWWRPFPCCSDLRQEMLLRGSPVTNSAYSLCRASRQHQRLSEQSTNREAQQVEERRHGESQGHV